jgi:hypothetical protein
MDDFGKAFAQTQLMVTKATTDTLTTVQGTALNTLDSLNNNNIASTTAATLNKVSSAIDTVCVGLGLGEK